MGLCLIQFRISLFYCCNMLSDSVVAWAWLQIFGPWASRLFCSLVKSVLDRFCTHFFVASIRFSDLCMYELLVQSTLFEQPLIFCCCNASNLDFCLPNTLICLHSITFFIRLLHSSKVSWSWSKILFNWWKHASLLNMNISNMLFIVLMHSFNNCFSALLIIWIPLAVWDIGPQPNTHWNYLILGI